MKNYLDLMKIIMHSGVHRTDRTGTGTRSIFGAQLRWDLRKGFPAITTKKLAWRAVVSELLWFLEGSCDERRLAEILHGTRAHNKTTIWTANSQADYWRNDSEYEGDLGVVYGNQWRKWPGNPENVVIIPRRTALPVNEVVISTPLVTLRSDARAYKLWQKMISETRLSPRATVVTTCDRWCMFENFANDIKAVPGYYHWANEQGYKLDATYYGAGQYGPDTTIFLKKTHIREIGLGACMETPTHLTRREFYVDQIQNLIDGIKREPYGRRHIITAWNPAQLSNMALPPCHMMAQFYVSNGELSCQMYQRSVDVGLGLPFNIASYSLLTHMIAQICGLAVGEFVHVSGDAHVYSNHTEALEMQLAREPYALPTLVMPQFDTLDQLLKTGVNEYVLEDYTHHSPIQMIMAV